MAEEKIELNYDEFPEAVSTINTLNESVEQSKNIIKSNIQNLDGGDVFEGPIADSMKEGFSKLNNAIDLISENFSILGRELTAISQNYNAADANAQQQLFMIKEDGKVELTDRPVYINNNASEKEVEFINQVLPGAIELYNKYGILPSLTLGQAAHESGFGDGDSLFGIKATSGWKGDKINAKTWESGANGAYNTNADFRAYDSVNAAIEDYGKVIEDSFPDVQKAKDYKEAVVAVQNGKWGKYATDPNYIPIVTGLIEDYNLNQWDPK